VLNLFQRRTYAFSVMVILAMFLFSTENPSQNNLRIFEDIGGGSSSSQGENSNDNITIYVVGGLLIAGIVAYALFFKDKKDETDTTSSSLLFENSDFAEFEPAEKDFQKMREKMPVELYLGISNNEAVLNDKMYQLGLRVKF